MWVTLHMHVVGPNSNGITHVNKTSDRHEPAQCSLDTRAKEGPTLLLQSLKKMFCKLFSYSDSEWQGSFLPGSRLSEKSPLPATAVQHSSQARHAQAWDLDGCISLSFAGWKAFCHFTLFERGKGNVQKEGCMGNVPEWKGAQCRPAAGLPRWKPLPSSHT